jgi:phosphoribosylformylglycinamidine synthase
MWQFAEAVRGLADGCRALGLPVTGGNVSFYNQTGDTAINPTPIIGVLGVIDDVTRRTSMAFGTVAEEVLFLLGETAAEFGGSEWAWAEHHHLGGQPPAVDLERERALADVLCAAATEGLVSAAHDLSDGGLAQALVECCLRGDVGARVDLTGDPFVALFSESAGRVLVALPAQRLARFVELCGDHTVPVAELGTVERHHSELTVTGHFGVPLAALRTAYSGTLAALFG